MPEPKLTSFSLTHVYYDASDPTYLSHLSACLALVPQALVVAYASLLFSTREIELAMMAAGQTLSEAANFFVKRHIKEERPPSMLFAAGESGYGMPSSHAQFAAFFSTYVVLFLLLRHAPAAGRTLTPASAYERVGTSVLAGVGAASVAASRVWLGYHTPKQVLVGAGLGVVLASAWFVVVGVLRHVGVVAWIVDSEPARWLRVRDLMLEEDFADAGWARWKARRDGGVKKGQ